MDWVKWKDKSIEFMKKYRYAALVLAAGLLLMLLPVKTQPQSQQTTNPTEAIQITVTDELTQILGQIQGVGKVRVMLTVASGEQTLYQYDENITQGENGSIRKETVIVTDSDRNEAGLVQQIIPVKYQGALIVCDGADRPAVCLAVVEAVSKVTGLATDRISVLKMK